MRCSATRPAPHDWASPFCSRCSRPTLGFRTGLRRFPSRRSRAIAWRGHGWRSRTATHTHTHRAQIRDYRALAGTTGVCAGAPARSINEGGTQVASRRGPPAASERKFKSGYWTDAREGSASGQFRKDVPFGMIRVRCNGQTWARASVGEVIPSVAKLLGMPAICTVFYNAASCIAEQGGQLALMTISS